MKNKIVIFILLFIILISVSIGLYFWLSLPNTPKEQLEHAQKIKKKLDEELTIMEVNKPDEFKKKKEVYYQKMIDEYQKVMKKYPKDSLVVNAKMEIADIYSEKMQKYDLAMKEYEEIISKYNKSSLVDDAIYKLAKIKSEKLKDDKYKLSAIDDLRNLIEHYPQSDLTDDATFKIGEIYESIKEFDKAIEWYKAVVEKYPKSPLAPEAQYRIAKIYQDEIKDMDSASEAYDKLTKDHPDSKQAKDAEAKKKKLAEEQAKQKSEEIKTEYYGGVQVQDFMGHVQKEEAELNERVYQQKIDVISYNITTKLNPDDHSIESSVTMELENKGEAKNRLVIRLNRLLEVEYVKAGEQLQNAKDVKFERENDAFIIKLDSALKTNDKVVLNFKYKGITGGGSSWYGDIIDEKGGYLRIESKWYPQNYWGDLAKVYISITVPKEYSAISVGALKSEQKDKNEITYDWQMDMPIFGVVIAVGKYKVKTIQSMGISLSCYFFESEIDKANQYLAESRKILDFYQDKFGKYPYPKFAVVQIPFFPGGYGAPSFVMLNETAIRENKDVPVSFLAHEISHQWWGNYVTLSLIGESIAWLSEGFATYSDALYIEKRDGVAKMREHLVDLRTTYLKSVEYAPDEPIITCNWASSIYQPVVYYKGANVLHMLRYVMGDDAFFSAFKKYSTKYALKIAELKDFIAVCEETSGKDLDWFFEQWIHKAGSANYILDGVDVATDKGEYVSTVRLLQDGAVFSMPVEVLLKTNLGETKKQITFDSQNAKVVFNTKSQPIEAMIDKDNWILKKSKESDWMWKAPTPP